MPEQLVEFDSGELVLASAAKRTVTGLLLPFGTPGYTNIGAFTVEAGAITLPADPNVITLNVEHDRERPVGRATSIEERADGVYATFELARTADGDAALDEIASGTRKSLSMEAKGVIVRAGKALAGAIFGAGLVERPAFAGATVIASYNDEAASVDAALRTVSTSTFTDQSESSRSEVIGDQLYVTNTKTESTTTTETAIDTPNDADASESENTMPEAVVPETVAARRAPAPRTNYRDAFRVMAAYHNGTLDNANEYRELMTPQSTVFAAQSVVGFPVGNADPRPDWLGEFWGEIAPPPVVSDLLTQGPLTKRQVEGFRTTSEPAAGDWAGNGAEITSGAISFESDTYTAQAFAGGNLVNRENLDFGLAETFFEWYFRRQAINYVAWSDGKALSGILSGLTPVAADAVPSNIDAGTSALVDAVVSYVLARNTLPSFVLMSATAYKSMLKAPSTAVLGYLAAALGVQEGDLAGIRIRPAADAKITTTGDNAHAYKAVAGNRSAARWLSLPGSAPIRAEALDVAHGQIQVGVYGYGLYVPDAPADFIGIY